MTIIRPSAVLRFTHSSNKFSCTSGIKSPSLSVTGGASPVASFGLFDATGDKAGNCDMKSSPATTASVMRRVLWLRRMKHPPSSPLDVFFALCDA